MKDLYLMYTKRTFSPLMTALFTVIGMRIVRNKKPSPDKLTRVLLHGKIHGQIAVYNVNKLIPAAFRTVQGFHLPPFFLTNKLMGQLYNKIVRK